MSFDSKHPVMTAERYEFFVVGQEPISERAIAQARFDYMKLRQFEPKILRLHPDDFYKLMTTVDLVPLEATKTYQGLEIQRDFTIKVNEWRVGDSNEKIEVEES